MMQDMICPHCSAVPDIEPATVKLVIELLELSEEGLTMGDIVIRTGIAVSTIREILRSLQTDGDLRARVEPVMRTVYRTKNQESG